MPPSTGIKTALNSIREAVVQENKIYGQYFPIIDDTTNIATLAEPVLKYKPFQNSFLSALVNKIVYTQFNTKQFNNPLLVLEGEGLPLGYTGEIAYINPARGRQFNNEDFAGLLRKYEADVKTQYISINSDLQYPVTISYRTLKQAFTSWSNFEGFVNGLTNSLYNGAYIDQYTLTKSLVSAAYKAGNVNVVKLTAPTDETTGEAFVTKARELFLDFQAPSSNHNGWALAGGEGRPVTTWTNPEDIVFLIKNSALASLDVNVMASAFNIDKAKLMGNIIPVDNFDLYNDDGTKNFDGSAIIGLMADKAWFKIQQQDEAMDEFYNPNNRTHNFYLNIVRSYNYSLFANGVVFATAEPTLTLTDISWGTDSAMIEQGASEGFDLTLTPASATDNITYTVVSAPSSADTTDLTLTPGDDTHSVTIAVAADTTVGTYVVQAKSGEITANIDIVVTAAA